ncbi:hypothetical protein [Paenibacillus beijingensis]|uniref:Uncharacterized protein n=1 Tax=Paenibacillus beijingensis TaxID=1126833 RepID=A0A0D5NM94_9BACL|nr:hypothetical protein VN24_20080 [Paenibacillus beijingensis]
MLRFGQKFGEWMQVNLSEEKNHRRREWLEKGPAHGTVEFLREVWHQLPAVRPASLPVMQATESQSHSTKEASESTVEVARKLLFF